MKVDFLFIGPQRTGTSWIDVQLRSHPSIILPKKVKETFFFDRFFHRGLRWYINQFPNQAPAKVFGEVAPSYFHCGATHKRIKNIFPDCKILITLRNPRERVVSLYLYYLRCGYTALPLVKAVDDHPDLLNSLSYFPNLPRWIESFGAEKCLILNYDELKQSPKDFLSSMYQFLNIQPFFVPERLGKQVNVTSLPRFRLLTRFAKIIANKILELEQYDFINLLNNLGLKRLIYKEDVNLASRKYLVDLEALEHIFAAEIDKLEQYFGTDLSVWKRPAAS